MCISTGKAALTALFAAFVACSATADETLITVAFDPATGATTEIPFQGTHGRIAELSANQGGTSEPPGNMIDIALLESFSEAIPASAPYVDAVQLDDSLDIPFGIIGEDDRVRVEPTNLFPARAMTHVLFKTATGRDSVCSGSLISADTVLTAGHCVQHKSYGGWNTDYRVLPGRNGPLAHFGECGVATVLTLKGWTVGNRREMDLAALKLDCTIGAETGHLGLKPTPPSGEVSLSLQGYPGEKKLRGLQFRSADIIREWRDHTFDHEADTTGGMSGAPILDASGTIIGVHTATTKAENWTRENQLGVENHATRITERRLQLIQSWIDM